MMRFITCVALSLCVIGLAVVAGQQTPVFRGTGDAVRVFVTVTDGDGRLVTTLTRENFEVRDEGKPQPITLFDNTPQPIRLIVMLDVSGSMEGNLPLLRAAADQLFARLRPDDVVKVGSFGREVTHQPLVHTRRERAAERAAEDDRARRADAVVACVGCGAGRFRRGSRCTTGDSRAERRQRQRLIRFQFQLSSRSARPRLSTARAPSR